MRVEQFWPMKSEDSQGGRDERERPGITGLNSRQDKEGERERERSKEEEEEEEEKAED